MLAGRACDPRVPIRPPASVIGKAQRSRLHENVLWRGCCAVHLHLGREGPKRRRRRQSHGLGDPRTHGAGHNRRCAALTHSPQAAPPVGGTLRRARQVPGGGPRLCGPRHRCWRRRPTRRSVRRGKRRAARRSVHGHSLRHCLHAVVLRRARIRMWSIACGGPGPRRTTAAERWTAGPADVQSGARTTTRVSRPPPAARRSLWFARPPASASSSRALPARFEVRKGATHRSVASFFLGCFLPPDEPGFFTAVGRRIGLDLEPTLLPLHVLHWYRRAILGRDLRNR